MSPARGRGDAGFLLAETLITFALSALVLLGLVSAAAVLLRATDRSVAAVGSTDDLGRALAALGRDVSGLKRARWFGDEPRDFVFRGGPNSLFFAQDVPAPDGGRERQVVSLREIAAGSGTALMRAEAHLPATAAGWSDLRFGPGRVVRTGPARLRFRYLPEPTAETPAPRALDAWPSGPTLPAAVIVEAVDAGSKRPLVSDRIAVRADGDIGCADRTATRRDAKAPALAGQPGAPAAGQPADNPATPAAAAPGLNINVNINDSGGPANKNEFCGRADKGSTHPAAAAGPGVAIPGAATSGGAP